MIVVGFDCRSVEGRRADHQAVRQFFDSGAGALQLSTYEIVEILDPAKTRATLGAVLGVIAEVRKQRTLLMRATVRLHLDRVEELGEFGEIEAVIPEGGDPECSRASVDELLAALQISRETLIDVSYFELAARRR